jgi:predicted nuclease of predicted toxin-antitoxin system
MAIRYHLDENVSGTIASALRRRGIDVTTSVDVGLIGAVDSEQLRFAESDNRVFVTHDDDFTRIHAEGIAHPGICYCHKDKHSVGDLVRLLILVHECYAEEEMRGHFEFL